MSRGYDRDRIVNRICALENRVAVLEGREAPHKERCLTCNGTGRVRDFNPQESWEEPCPDCGGKG